MKIRRTLATIGTLGLVSVGLFGVAAPVQAAPASAADCPGMITATAHVKNRPDGGHWGKWALLEYDRTVKLCPGDANSYTATVTDLGTFASIAGAKSPNSATPGALMAGVMTGTFEGGYTATFTAVGAHDVTKVNGKTFDGDPTAAGADPAITGPTTGGWIAYMFNGGITTGSGLDGDSWSWTYTACNGETWVNQAAAKGAETGDITGTPACPAPTPTPAASPSQTSQTSQTGTLSNTGASVTGVVTAGVAAVVLGVLLVAFAGLRRARRQH